MIYKDYVDEVFTKIRETNPELTEHVTKNMVNSILRNVIRTIVHYVKQRCYVDLKFLKIFPIPSQLLYHRRRLYAIRKKLLYD